MAYRIVLLARINLRKLQTASTDELGIICHQVSTLTRGKLKEVLGTNCTGVFFTFSWPILLEKLWPGQARHSTGHQAIEEPATRLNGL